eukprot:366588-Prymnesium_polylepis.1
MVMQKEAEGPARARVLAPSPRLEKPSKPSRARMAAPDGPDEPQAEETCDVRVEEEEPAAVAQPAATCATEGAKPARERRMRTAPAEQEDAADIEEAPPSAI